MFKIIKEAKKTRQQELDDLADLFAEFDVDLPSTTTKPGTISPDQIDQQEPVDPRGQRASQADTMRATSGIRMDPRAQDLMRNMRNIEADPDDPGYPSQNTRTPGAERTANPNLLGSSSLTTTTHENLPKVVSQALVDAGYVSPKWHQVANLPGNMATAIRTLGRRLFAAFTDTPTDQIWVVANLAGQGPNTPREVNSVASWIVKAGDRVDTADIDFETTIPGYKAEVMVYDAAGVRWMLVKDEFGTYIYSWPAHESKNYSPTRQITR
jgi:hypothetical protein